MYCDLADATLAASPSLGRPTRAGYAGDQVDRHKSFDGWRCTTPRCVWPTLPPQTASGSAPLGQQNCGGLLDNVAEGPVIVCLVFGESRASVSVSPGERRLAEGSGSSVPPALAKRASPSHRLALVTAGQAARRL